MNVHQIRNYERLARVREFGRANAAAFPSDSDAGALLTRLGVLVDALAASSAAATAGLGLAREGSAGRRAARAALREHLEAVSRTARAIALTVPHVDEKFRLPAAGRDQALLAAARAFASAAAALEQEFARYALDGAFFARLEGAITAFERAISGQHGGRQTRAAASGAIAQALAEGTRIVRQLDTYLKNRFAREPATLSAWREASRTRRPGRRRSREANGAEPPGPPGPVAEPQPPALAAPGAE